MKYQKNVKFEKDFKKLLKKFRTLEEDFETFKKSSVELLHVHKVENPSLLPVPGFESDVVCIYKAKKFACKALKGKGARSGIRVVYALFLKENKIEFLQIYFKEKHKTDLDSNHLKAYIKGL